ncbi:hypothetical protein Tsp_07718 [Trichinella spiralis]|uniref:hypothetical protein n=1 Tax=Trichinella spiralis TaxID=6334 RepID=UPI0001EFC826|nr:hypothetical protein Tsp_07718 [Trichinella spiralis]
MIQTTLRQSSSAGARIDLSSVRFPCDMTKISNCGLRHPMNLVPFATRVHMDVKALPSRPSVPLLITNSQRRNSIFRSRWHSQIAFNTVLMIIVFNVLVRNCEDESRILNDLHRITSRDSVKYWYVASRECPGHSLKANENLHIPLKANIVQKNAFGVACENMQIFICPEA